MNITFVNDYMFIITHTKINNIKTYQGQIDCSEENIAKQIYKLLNEQKYEYVEHKDKLVIKLTLNHNNCCDYNKYIFYHNSCVYDIICKPIYNYIANESTINSLIEESNPIIKNYIFDLKNRIFELEYTLENKETEIEYLNNKLDNLYDDILESNSKKNELLFEKQKSYISYNEEY